MSVDNKGVICKELKRKLMVGSVLMRDLKEVTNY